MGKVSRLSRSMEAARCTILLGLYLRAAAMSWVRFSTAPFSYKISFSYSRMSQASGPRRGNISKLTALSPRSRSMRHTWLPINPDPPVMSTVSDMGRSSCNGFASACQESAAGLRRPLYGSSAGSFQSGRRVSLLKAEDDPGGHCRHNADASAEVNGLVVKLHPSQDSDDG